jgi:hypothetical protein
VIGVSFALLWLTGRKRPGKICRRTAVSPVREGDSETGPSPIIFTYQYVNSKNSHGTALA